MSEGRQRTRKMLRHKLKQLSAQTYFEMMGPCWGVLRPMGRSSLVPVPKAQQTIWKRKIMEGLHWFVVFGLLHLAVPDHDTCTKIQAMNPDVTAVECWAADKDYDKPKVATDDPGSDVIIGGQSKFIDPDKWQH